MKTTIRTPRRPNFLWVQFGSNREETQVSIADVEPAELEAVADDWKKKLLEDREKLIKIRRDERQAGLRL